MKNFFRKSNPKWITFSLACLLVGVAIGYYMSPLPKGFDTLVFVETALAIVIACLTVVGAVFVVSAWNDIDKRAKDITDKYKSEIWDYTTQRFDLYNKWQKERSQAELEMFNFRHEVSAASGRDRLLEERLDHIDSKIALLSSVHSPDTQPCSSGSEVQEQGKTNEHGSGIAGASH